MKTAVILMNLGGPDTLKAVKPFLFNLFNDPAIIRLPNPFRYCLAKFIASRRENEAQEIYETLGGGSPLVSETHNQAQALKRVLGKDYKVFVAMRYWHPFTEEAYEKVKAYKPDQIVLLPLYPQYSTTTTASSFARWQQVSPSLKVPTHRLCCYPKLPGLIDYFVGQIEAFYRTCKQKNQLRLLFTAHSLPEKIVAAGDPYPAHVQTTVEAIVARLTFSPEYVICYQSKVGPLPWLKPATDKEIERAGDDKKGVLLVPVSFVSEHSETLYELDIQYKKLAKDKQLPFYHRVMTPQTDKDFIESLAALVKQPIHFQACENKACCQKGMKYVA